MILTHDMGDGAIECILRCKKINLVKMRQKKKIVRLAFSGFSMNARIQNYLIAHPSFPKIASHQIFFDYMSRKFIHRAICIEECRPGMKLPNSD